MPEKLGRATARVDTEEFSRAVINATTAMLAERKAERIEGGLVKGDLVQLTDAGRLAIVSDLHGDVQTLIHILERIDFDRFVSDKANKIVFLGDYVDRGSDSVGVLYLICQLKHKHPGSVIVMRGNHEAPSEFPFLPHDLPYALKDRFGSSAKKLYLQTLSLFRLMTLATIIKGKLLLVHGGLPTETSDPGFLNDAQQTHTHNRVMEEILWNDPRPIKGWTPSLRGMGRYFGRDITESWLKSTGTEVVVRGHEHCAGYRIDHEGLIFTLFSSKEAYHTFEAAYLLVESDSLAKVKRAQDLVGYVTKL